MTLDVRDVAAVAIRDEHRGFDHLELTVHARRCVADLSCAVIVDRRADDDRVDHIAVDDRVVEALEHDDAGTFAENTVPSPRHAENGRQCPSALAVPGFK